MDRSRARISSNIIKLQLFQLFRWFLIVMPVVVIYFQDNGLSLAEVMIVQAVFSVSMLLFEVPSGYLSDRLGRKPTLMAGTALSAVGMAGLALFPSLPGFCISEVLLGIGASCISGTDSSLLFDSLVNAERTEDHHRVESRVMATMNFSEAAAGILGGFLAVVSYRLGFLAQVVVLLAAFGVAATLVEPERPAGRERRPGIRDFARQLKEILGSRGPRYLILNQAMAGLGTFMAVWYVQPLLRDFGYPIASFGLIWAGLNGLVGLSTLLGRRLPLFRRPLLFVALLPLLFSGIYFAVSRSNGFWLIPSLLPFYILRGLQGPYLRNLLHLRLDSAHRATGLSLVSLLLRFLFSLLAPLFGGIADRNGSQAAMAWIGLFFLAFGVLNLLLVLLRPGIRRDMAGGATPGGRSGP